MIRRWRTTGYPRAAAGAGSDTDALQTDVMRFMSILGLCLMAIFALVQSLPLRKAEHLQQDPKHIELRADVAVLQQRARTLKAELQRLLLLSKQMRAVTAGKERVLINTQQQLADVDDDNAKAQAEQQRLTREIHRLQQRLEHSRYALTSLQRAVDEKVQSLHTLEQRLKLEKRRLDEIRQEARAVKLKQAEEQRRQAVSTRHLGLKEQNQEQTRGRDEEQRRKQGAPQRPKRVTGSNRIRVPPAARTAEEQTRQPAKKGFTLRFASNDALQRQVATGQVKLYAMANKQAWRLSLPLGRPVFVDAAFPGWFHEMATYTVPTEYLQRLESTVVPKASGVVVWGVQLPLAIKRDIASLTRGRQGGELVIASNGLVRLTGE